MHASLLNLHGGWIEEKQKDEGVGYILVLAGEDGV